MPSETFYNLSEEKKQKIIDAALEEYSRVSVEEASIKNITENAGIARGSFYQYFDSKQDLLEFLLKQDIDEIREFVKKDIENESKDIFELYLDMFDYVIKRIFSSERLEFHKKILKNLKTSDDTNFMICSPMFIKNIKGPFQDKIFVDKINKNNLKLNDESDIKALLKILFLITRKSLVSAFMEENFEDTRKEYIKMLEIIKFGIVK